MTSPGKLYTIGIDSPRMTRANFFKKLYKHDVNVLCDVRSYPVSKRYGFSMISLGHSCDIAGMLYESMPGLGFRRDTDEVYDSDSSNGQWRNDFIYSILPKQTYAMGRIASFLRSGNNVALVGRHRLPTMCTRGVVSERIDSGFGSEFKTVHL